MASLTGEPGGVLEGLVDCDTFFEFAARGERGAGEAVAAPDRGVGAATMPRAARAPAPSAARPTSPAEHSERVGSRLSLGRAIALAGLTVSVVTGVAVVVAAQVGGPATSSHRGAAVAARPVPPMPRAGRLPADVLAPRLGRVSFSARRLAGVAYDPGSGVRRLEMHVDGRRVDALPGHCRPDCAPAARFSLANRLSSDEMHAVAVVAEDAAGNRALLWQRLVPPTGGRPTESLTAALEHRTNQLVAGSRYAITGRLLDRAGVPIRSGQVEVAALERTADAVPHRAAIVVTDDAGRWRVGGRRAADGSRVYVARPLNHTSGSAVSRAVQATVAFSLTARSRPDGRAVTGRVIARVTNGTAIRLLLASRRSNGWRTERSARARPGGRFELPVPARVRGRVAVFVAPSPGLPFAPAGRVVDLARP